MLTPLKRVSRYFTDKKRHARSRRIATTPFYRAHPYSGPVRLASLDSRVAIDFELGFLYNRVLKAANTTIIATLASLKNESGDNPKDLFRKPSDLTEAETQQVPSLFRFAFVRNPYSRTLSAYLDKIARGKRQPLELTRKSSRPPSFEDFCVYLEDGGLYENPHWAPQSSVLIFRPDDYDFIGRTESLGSDLNVVIKRLSSDAGGSGIVDRQLHRTGANTLIADHYSGECQRIVSSLFQEDFTAFGYSPSLPNH